MRVLVAMSGGVDSSVAAYLLKEQGYEVEGAILQLLPGENQAAQDAKAVADELHIPFHIIHMEDEFRNRVILPFVEAYESGLTPNPCVVCNRFIKFGAFWEEAQKLGCEFMATGHYVKKERCLGTNRWTFQTADDQGKDQTYMLWTLSQEQLNRTIFPLGSLLKSEVRKIAEAQGLVTAHKSDSQDICFVPGGDYASVIRAFSGKQYEKGPFLSTDGRVLGIHQGLIQYTVGQRRGLGLSLPAPLYVKEKRIMDNAVILASDEELFSSELYAEQVNWMKMETPEAPVRAKVKIRYHHVPASATVYPEENDRCHVVFDEPVRAVTPGQSVVFYDENQVMGGGFIC